MMAVIDDGVLPVNFLLTVDEFSVNFASFFGMVVNISYILKIILLT